MENIFRSARNKLRGDRRVLYGALLATLLTAGFWLLGHRPHIVFLGFRGGESFQKAEAQAAVLGFTRDGDCEYRQYLGRPPITDFTDCKFSKAGGEKMEMSFYHGQLQRINYDFDVSRYGEVVEAIRKDNRHSRSPIGRDVVVWGTFKQGTISLGKTAKGTNGFALVRFDIPELDQKMKDLQTQAEKQSKSAGSLQESENSHPVYSAQMPENFQPDYPQLKSQAASKDGGLGYPWARRQCENHILQDESSPNQNVRFVDISTDIYYQHTHATWVSYNVITPAVSHTAFMRAVCMFDASDDLYGFSRYQRDPTSGRTVGGAMLDLPNGAVPR
jgi:hypothetical protein